MIKLSYTNQFKKDFKLIQKRCYNVQKLEDVLIILTHGKQLPEKYKDHPLSNSKNYSNVRECHVEPDWLLIYKIEKENYLLKLIRTGTHSDLFC